MEISGGPGRVSVAALQELWQFREVLWAFVTRDVKVKYKQAVIGVGWAVLQPVLAAAVFAVFLGRYSTVASEGRPYLLFALAGMAAWTFFSSATGSGSTSVVTNQGLLRKVYFPRELLPLSSVMSSLIDLLFALVVLVVAAGLYGVAPTVAWLALPLPVAVLVVAAAALSVGLAAINVYYRDVRYALPFVLQLGLFASPVVYSLSVLPSTWRNLYAVLNPVASAIDGLRRIALHGQWPNFAVSGAALVWSLALLLVAYTFFKRLERGFADRA